MLLDVHTPGVSVSLGSGDTAMFPRGRDHRSDLRRAVHGRSPAVTLCR